jgi:hypothetical protein
VAATAALVLLAREWPLDLAIYYAIVDWRRLDRAPPLAGGACAAVGRALGRGEAGLAVGQQRGSHEHQRRRQQQQLLGQFGVHHRVQH